MKVIYPEETLTLLAKYDVLINAILEEYREKQRLHPNQDWSRAIQEDPYYQACIEAKAKIISLSPCTYQIIIDEERREEQQ